MFLKIDQGFFVQNVLRFPETAFNFFDRHFTWVRALESCKPYKDKSFLRCILI